MGYYIAAPLKENEARYKELITRVQANLPEDDPLRAPLIDAVSAGLEEFTQARAELAKARTAYAMARTESDAVEDEWDTLMEKTYGLLIADLGKKAAERFFPKLRKSRREAERLAPFGPMSPRKWPARISRLTALNRGAPR